MRDIGRRLFLLMIEQVISVVAELWGRREPVAGASATPNS